MKGENKLATKTKNWLKRSGVNSNLVDSLKNRSVVQRGYNLIDTNNASKEMLQTRRLYNNFKTNSNQSFQIIQSFSKNELSAIKPNDWTKAAKIGTELAKMISPKHEFYIGVHIDNQNHLVHNHIIMNSPNIETGKKFHESHPFDRISYLNDQLAKKYGMTPLPRQAHTSKRTNRTYWTQNTKETQKRSLSERQLCVQRKYIWKEDLRSRIDRIMQNKSTIDLRSFNSNLELLGVHFHDRNSSSSYNFIDKNHKARRIRGYRLGKPYTKEQIFNELGKRQIKQERVQQRKLSDNPSYDSDTEKNYRKSETDYQKSKENYQQTKKSTQSRIKYSRAITKNSKILRDIKEEKSTKKPVYQNLRKSPTNTTTTNKITQIKPNIEIQTLTPDTSDATNKDEAKAIIKETNSINKRNQEITEMFNKNLQSLFRMLDTISNLNSKKKTRKQKSSKIPDGPLAKYRGMSPKAALNDIMKKYDNYPDAQLMSQKEQSTKRRQYKKMKFNKRLKKQKQTKKHYYNHNSHMHL